MCIRDRCRVEGLSVQGLGSRVEGRRSRFEGLGCRVEGLVSRGEGVGSKVEGLRFRIWEFRFPGPWGGKDYAI
eukprot:2159827-Rhodomonas_salina.1